MNQVNKLEWDSNFFKLEVGDLNLINSVLPNCDNFDLIYVKTEKGEEIKIKNFEKTYTETKIVFRKFLNGLKNSCNAVFDISEIDYSIEELNQLAYESGKYSRFKLDRRIDSNKFFELYELWIINSLNKKFADDIFVYQEDSTIIGFVTYKVTNNYATIGLIAVSPNHQGKGIGKQLIDKVENELFKKNINELRIPTQEENIQACFFYEKLGYKKLEVININHYWKK